MNRINTQKGFSLVETLVAISILLISITAPLTIASKSLQNNFLAREQYTATMLAQEGVEAVYSMQRSGLIDAVQNGSNPWEWFNTLPAACSAAAGCAIDFSDTAVAYATAGSVACDNSSDPCLVYFDETAARAPYSHDVSATATPFTRTIRVTDTGGGPLDQVMVESTVTWQSPIFQASSSTVTVRSALLNTATTSI